MKTLLTTLYFSFGLRFVLEMAEDMKNIAFEVSEEKYLGEMPLCP